MVFLYEKNGEEITKMKKVILSLVVGCGFSILLTGYETNMSDANKKISTFNQIEVQNVLTNTFANCKSQQIVWDQVR